MSNDTPTAAGHEAAELSRLPRVTLTDRQLFDVEQILCGGFAPLTGFLNEDDYQSVVDTMHLKSGALWPIPVVLDAQKDHGRKVGERIILCDTFGNTIAFMEIESIYMPDKAHEAQMVYGTQSLEHPGVRYLMEDTGPVYVGGKVELISYAPVHDFKELRFQPKELKERFAREGIKKVVAFQTRNPIHRAHFELIERSAKKVGGTALVHPVVGLTKDGDVDYVSRVRAYKRLWENRMQDFAMLALLPLAMRMAGPREALWHALIRRNYGATHFIVGRDHAGSADASGKPFYGPYDSQKLAEAHQAELGIEILPSPIISYVEGKGHVPENELQEGDTPKNISGTQFRKMLREGADIPEWFSFPEVVEELRTAMHKESRRGAVVFLTGLSGAGKSTIAHVLYHKLLESYDRTATLLDGDVVRRHLSKGLGFSREDRNENIERIGFVAAEIAKHGGIAICSAIAPYEEPRAKNRRLIGRYGTYIEVFVDTPMDVCEERDPKGLYKKARQGLLPNFTGVDDPYERPTNPELTINGSGTEPHEAAARILELLKEKGIL